MIDGMPPEAMRASTRRGSPEREPRRSGPPPKVYRRIGSPTPSSTRSPQRARKPTFYLVGSDAELIGRVVRHLPDRLRDRMMVRRRSH